MTFNDVRVATSQILQIFAENIMIFKFFPKILGICDFDFFNGNTNILGLEAKQTLQGGNLPSTLKFDSLP